MTQYNSLNVKLSNSQLNKLKSTIKNETEEVFIKLLLTNNQLILSYQKLNYLR